MQENVLFFPIEGLKKDFIRRAKNARVLHSFDRGRALSGPCSRKHTLRKARGKAYVFMQSWLWEKIARKKEETA